EKVRCLQMLVAIRIPGIDVRGLELDVECRLSRIGLIDINCPGRSIDPAIEIAHVEMLDAKRCGGVNRVDFVGITPRDDREAHQGYDSDQTVPKLHTKISFPEINHQ